MRVFEIARGYQVTEFGTTGAARQFLAWLAADTNRALAALIRRWLCQPADSGGLGALAAPAWDIVVLRAGAAATWQHGQARGEAAR